MIEPSNENQESYEDFLNGIAQTSYEPEFTQLEVRFTLHSLKHFQKNAGGEEEKSERYTESHNHKSSLNSNEITETLGSKISSK